MLRLILLLLYLRPQLQLDAMGQDNFFRLVSCFSAEIRRQNDVVANLEKRLLQGATSKISIQSEETALNQSRQKADAYWAQLQQEAKVNDEAYLAKIYETHIRRLSSLQGQLRYRWQVVKHRAASSVDRPPGSHGTPGHGTPGHGQIGHEQVRELTTASSKALTAAH